MVQRRCLALFRGQGSIVWLMVISLIINAYFIIGPGRRGTSESRHGSSASNGIDIGIDGKQVDAAVASAGGINSKDGEILRPLKRQHSLNMVDHRAQVGPAVLGYRHLQRGVDVHALQHKYDEHYLADDGMGNGGNVADAANVDVKGVGYAEIDVVSFEADKGEEDTNAGILAARLLQPFIEPNARKHDSLAVRTPQLEEWQALERMRRQHDKKVKMDSSSSSSSSNNNNDADDSKSMVVHQSPQKAAAAVLPADGRGDDDDPPAPPSPPQGGGGEVGDDDPYAEGEAEAEKEEAEAERQAKAAEAEAAESVAKALNRNLLKPAAASSSDAADSGAAAARDVRMMIGVITGGKKPATLSNRQAVLDTWFDQDAFMVTHDKVDTDRVIWLADIAETGGFKMLPRKVKHMFAHMYENHLNDYDWFIKADDDTFIHKERLRKTLSVFDPDIPMLLGKPYATKCAGVDGPGPLWGDFVAIQFCHGGSGYVMSRELLRRVGPYIQNASTVTSLEDAAVAAVAYEHTGVKCVNLNAKMFGGLDLVKNAHNQSLIVREVSKYMAQDPNIMAKTATVHAVEASTTHFLHDIFTKLDADTRRTEEVDGLASLALDLKRSTMVTSWNCTLDPPLEDQARHDAMCQQSALRMDPPMLPAIAEEFAQSFSELERTWPCRKRANEPAATYKATVGNARAWLRMPEADAASEPEPASRVELANNVPIPDKHAVLVSIRKYGEQIGALGFLVRSLRATGSTADVLVFAPDLEDHIKDVESFLGDAPCGIRFFDYDIKSVSDGLKDMGLHRAPLPMQGVAVMASALADEASSYEKVLLAPIKTYFQRDPFQAIYHTRGLTLFVASPIRIHEKPKCFGGRLRINEKAADIIDHLAIGTRRDIEVFLRTALQRPPKATKCQYEMLVALNVWRKVIADYVPVTILMPWDSPVVQLNKKDKLRMQRTNDGKFALVQNYFGMVAAAVVGYDSLATKRNGRIVLDNGRKSMSAVELAVKQNPGMSKVIKWVADYPLPARDHWPPYEKTVVRFNALMQKTHNLPAHDIWEPVWRILAELRAKYGPNAARDPIRHVAAPKLHKTGSTLLAGLLFRYCGRHGLRIWHKGQWAFMPFGTVLKPPPEEDKWKYNMVLDQVTARGTFRGPLEKLTDFYRHMISPDTAMVAMLREPKQHWISYLYYYVIPKKAKFKPEKVMKDYIKRRRNRNMMCGEFGIKTLPALNDFIENELVNFEVMLLWERLDESLVLMRRIFQWDILDITYLFAKVERVTWVTKRWDNKRLMPTPLVEDLDSDTVKKLANLNMLDQQLYDAASKRLDRQILEEGSSFKEELRDFRRLQAKLVELCAEYQEEPTCKWYRLSELELFHLISKSGHTAAVPMI